MRRLTEILALPKAWYRRTLARRLFLGEEMAGDILTDSGLFWWHNIPQQINFKRNMQETIFV